ncbi:outer membrane protein assembly factor BamE [Candidatus Pelagibacter bacterium]|nr:outer membrane protein assembly factor BamE [Candidatus Pelagibacter bacterium]
MKKIILLSLLLLASCSLEKKILHHGVHNLEKKQEKLKINETNSNEILNIIGPPSTISSFNNDLYFYIEKKTSSSKITSLGKKELITNNVLILELDNKGILLSKKFYNKEDMEKLKIDETITGLNISKKSFIETFLSSLIQKIDDPLGKKRVKN